MEIQIKITPENINDTLSIDGGTTWMEIHLYHGEVAVTDEGGFYVKGKHAGRPCAPCTECDGVYLTDDGRENPEGVCLDCVEAVRP